MEILFYYFKFIKFINKNILLLVLPSQRIFDIDCVSLINQYSIGLSNPKTQTMFGILELYDHIMLFLLLILIIKMIFFVNALSTSTRYMPAAQRLSEMHELWTFDFFCRRIGDNYEKVSRKNKKYFRTYASILVHPESRVINIKDVRSEHQETFYDQLWTFRLYFLKEWYWNYVNKRIYLWNHSPVIEYIWTVFPAVILGLMGVPSFLLLYSLEESADPVFNISVIGNQWYWTYEYLDFDIHKFFSILVFDRCGDELELVKQPLFNNVLLLNEVPKEEFSASQYIEANNILSLQVDCEKYFLSSLDEEQGLNFELINYTDLLHNAVQAAVETSILESDHLEDTYDSSLTGLVVNTAFTYFTLSDVSYFLPIYLKIDNIEGFNLINSSEDYKDSHYCSLITDIMTCLVEKKSGTCVDNVNNDELSTLNLPFVSYELSNNFSEILESLETTISMDSQILPDADLPLGYPRLLSTDQVLVIPTDTTIRFLVTSNDVIHSWALPSFGIKIDAVPGRINQVVTKTPFFGSTWGQCSELCGVNHGFMPIEIRAMALDDFNFYIKLLIRSIIEPGLDKLFSNSYIKVIFNSN